MTTTPMIVRSLVAMALLTLAASSGVAQQAPQAQQQQPAPILTGMGPNGATMRCRDGSYPAPFSADAVCDNKGGVLVRFPVRATPQRAAAPVRPQAAAARVARDAVPARPEGFIPWRERRAAVEAEAARERPPEGASLRCGDGSWVARDTSSARCDARGGVTLRVDPPIPRRGN